jgi:hypothetical protein
MKKYLGETQDFVAQSDRVYIFFHKALAFVDIGCYQ